MEKMIQEAEKAGDILPQVEAKTLSAQFIRSYFPKGETPNKRAEGDLEAPRAAAALGAPQMVESVSLRTGLRHSFGEQLKATGTLGCLCSQPRLCLFCQGSLWLSISSSSAAPPELPLTG